MTSTLAKILENPTGRKSPYPSDEIVIMLKYKPLVKLKSLGG